MTIAKLPGEPVEDAQRPIGNQSEGQREFGRPPNDTAGTYFRGRHKLPPMSEKDGVKPEGEQPDAAIRRTSNGK